MRYDFSRLGERAFVEMCSNLVCSYSADRGVHAVRTQQVGAAVLLDGLVAYPDPHTGEPWSGQVLIQPVYDRRSPGEVLGLDALKSEVAGNLDTTASVFPRGIMEGGGGFLQLIVVTDGFLSGRAVQEQLEALAGDVLSSPRPSLRVLRWDVWDYERIRALLDRHAPVRVAYAGFITPGDILATLPNVLPTAGALVDTLGRCAAKELIASQWVRLGQAGERNNEKVPLSSVAVDLPAEELGPCSCNGVAEHIVELGDAVYRSGLAPTTTPHLVVVGGPGQGKSTLGQLLCQVYRAALLSTRPSHLLGKPAADVLDQVQTQHLAQGIPAPRCLRWPVQVSLSKYADTVARHRGTGLLRYLASETSARAGKTVTAADLELWLKEWPWLLVLDGLDEVAAPPIREAVLHHISEFQVDAASTDADILVVGTTRPQGYAAEFRPYQHLHLRPLAPDEALRYASRLAAVRHGNDPETAERLREGMASAVHEPMTSRLMTTPLQVTIMSLLLERRVRAPQTRHDLFDAYYSTVFDREIGKGGSNAEFLEAQRGNINAIHERVGIILQLRAALEGESESMLSLARLEAVATERLTEQGYNDEDARVIAEMLLRVATHRLVLLVPRTATKVGFEIRSLQEFMAARALTRGEDHTVIERLRILAPAAHWRNTWMFAAASVFAYREHLRDAIITLLTSLDSADRVSALVAPGATLAIDLLEDGLAADAPRYQRLIAQQALHLLTLVPSGDLKRLAGVLLDVGRNQVVRSAVELLVDRSAGLGGRSLVTAMQLLTDMAAGSGAVALAAKQRADRYRRLLDQDQRRAVGLSSVLHAREPDAVSGSRRVRVDLAALRRELEPHLCPAAVQEIIKILTGIVTDPPFAYPSVERMGETNRRLLAEAADALPVVEWTAVAWLRDVLAEWHARRPVAAQLLEDPGLLGDYAR